MLLLIWNVSLHCVGLFPITFLSLNFFYEFHLFCCLCAEHSWDNNIWACALLSWNALCLLIILSTTTLPWFCRLDVSDASQHKALHLALHHPLPLWVMKLFFFSKSSFLYAFCTLNPFFSLCDVFDVLCVWLQSLWLWMLPAILSLLIFFNLPLIKFI